MRKIIFSALILASLGLNARAESTAVKSEAFDHDPGWEGHNNRIVSKHPRTVAQDFGWQSAGKIGGTVWRSTTPAFYAEKIAPKTLQDKLSASGTFDFTASTGNSGMFFGWFNAKQPGGSRPVSSLGMDFDGEKAGLRLSVRMISAANKSCGTFITPFIPGKFRPTPISNKSVRYHWTLNYDPKTSAIRFTIKSDATNHEEFEGKTFTVEVPPALKAEGTVFDRFGMVNMGRPGNALTVHFEELQEDGKALDLSHDPNWEGSGNRVTFADQETGGAQNFGFSPTSFAGGKSGEIGGAFWRTEKDFGYYADRIGALNLANRIEASGRIILAVGAPDSAACLGWFNSAAKDTPPDRSANFLGMVITGPTRVGHYFSPACTTAKGTRANAKSGPILVPGQPHQWTFLYDPKANAGQGSILVTLDQEKIQLDLKAGQKAEGATFDRFGLFSTYPGGGLVRMFVDDLKYSTRSAGR